MSKASEGDGIPVELFQILKDDAVKVLHSICQQIWKLNKGHRTEKKNRRGNSGNNVRLCFLGSKITADGDCSYGIKIRLLLGRKVMTNLDSSLKSRDITLPTKVRLVKAMVFPVVM